MKKSLFGLVLAAVVVMPGWSQAINDKDADEKSVIMEKIVVTGTRVEQKIEKVPANITVITAEDILDSNAQNIPDLLRSEEGVSVRDLLGNGKNAQIDLRGFGETGPYNTLVLVDGRRVNEIDLSGVDWTQIPIEEIERIEIVRGTGSVLYGDNAVGGVINIITKIPTEQTKISGGISSGSYGFYQGKVSISGGRDIISGSLFASYHETDGYRANNDFEAKNIGGKIVFNPSENFKLDLSSAYHEDEFGLPGHLTEAQYALNRENSAFPLDEGQSNDYYIKLGTDLAIGSHGSIITDVALRNRKNEAKFPDPTGTFPQASDTETETWSITPRYIWNGEILNHSNTFIAGADFYWSEQDTNSFGGFFVPLTMLTGVSNVQRDTYGFYFNNNFSISEDLILSIGARQEKVKYKLDQRDLSAFPLAPLNETITDNENAYNIGLTFLYGENSSLFIRTNRSFRFPLTDEVAYIDWLAGQIKANTDIKPQTGKHFEIGIKHFFAPNFMANITLFQSKIDNELFYNPLTFSNENHPETLHRGFEIGSKIVLSKKFTIFGNYTYQEATFEQNPYADNDIPAVPRHRANLGFKIQNIIPGLIFSTDYNFVGSSYAISDQANNFQKLDQHFTINSRISYDWKNIKAFAGINNITNEKYADYAIMDTFLTKRNFYPAPERNWIAGIEIYF